MPRPLTIFYKGGNKSKVDTTSQLHAPKLIVKVPSPFPYQSDKVVLWKYLCDITTPAPLVIPIRPSNTNNEAVNDVTGLGEMTCSDSCYASSLIGVGQRDENVEGKGTKIAKTRKQKEKTVILPPAKINASITEVEASEFLKFIKYSEYNVVEQLNKTPIRIFLLSLLISSEPHRDAL